MNDRYELEIRLYQRPLSAFKANGVKIPYNDLLQAGLYPDCGKALSIMGKAIDEKFPKIVEFINESPLHRKLHSISPDSPFSLTY